MMWALIHSAYDYHDEVVVSSAIVDIFDTEKEAILEKWRRQDEVESDGCCTYFYEYCEISDDIIGKIVFIKNTVNERR